jgi:CBS domain-containing protein/biotin operon repressor
VWVIQFNERQQEILEIIKYNGPISGEGIAARLKLTRASLRPHLAVLTMSGMVDARPRVGYFYTGKNSPRFVTEALKNITVGEIKGRPVVVRPETTVYDAIVTLFLDDVGTLFVVNEDVMLQGVVSRKDFLKAALGGANLHKMPVGVIMTRMPQVHIAFEDETILDVAQRMMEYEVDSLPVVRNMDKTLKVLGRVTKTNLVRLMVELGEGR